MGKVLVKLKRGIAGNFVQSDEPEKVYVDTEPGRIIEA